MSSKMREALEAAYKAGRSDMLGEIASAGNDLADQAERVNEIAQRYGDLAFTLEEVRGMLENTFEEATSWAECDPHRNPWEKRLILNSILSRHLGESESDDEPPNIQFCGECLTKHRPDEECNPSLDREVGELHGELIALTKRVAAIEKRVLADGHSNGCRYAQFVGHECNCGYDEVREASK